MIYSILILTPGGPKDQINQLKQQSVNGKPVNVGLIDYYTKIYGLDKPYPLNYLLWLFDPAKTSETTYDIKGNSTTKPIGVNLFGLRGTGILTGDLGKSVKIDLNKPVVDLMGATTGEHANLDGAVNFDFSVDSTADWHNLSNQAVLQIGLHRHRLLLCWAIDAYVLAGLDADHRIRHHTQAAV